MDISTLEVIGEDWVEWGARWHHQETCRGSGSRWRVEICQQPQSLSFFSMSTNMHSQKCLQIREESERWRATTSTPYTPEGDLSDTPFSTSSILSSSITTEERERHWVGDQKTRAPREVTVGGKEGQQNNRRPKWEMRCKELQDMEEVRPRKASKTTCAFTPTLQLAVV